MTPADLARVVIAHDAVWDGWWPVLASLSPAQAHQTIPSSYPTVFATIAHMVVAEAFWQHRLDGGPMESVADALGDLAGLERAWRVIQRRRQEWVDQADPQADVSFTLATGYRGTVKAWECVCHLASHAHFHRGQVVTQLRQLGVTPPSFDLLGSFAGAF
jgi:uncharacterized damage-inducible protein DinB